MNEAEYNHVVTNGDMIIEMIKHTTDPSNDDYFDSADICEFFINPLLLEPKGIDCKHTPCAVCYVLLTKWWDQICYWKPSDIGRFVDLNKEP